MDVRESVALALSFGWISLPIVALAQASGQATGTGDGLRIHVVFDNVAKVPGLRTGWGFACLVETEEATVLFDTGGDGAVLLANLEALGLDPGAVDGVVLSHLHGDHVGGLDAFLARNPAATVYLPASFPAAFRDEVAQRAAAVEAVSVPARLFGAVHSTGEMGTTIREQALILDTPAGLVVITGCAHPGVAEMAEAAAEGHGKPVHLLMGGFHLGGSGEAEIRAILGHLRALGVERVAPSHCTGDLAVRMLREAWGDDFVESGLGAVIELPR